MGLFGLWLAAAIAAPTVEEEAAPRPFRKGREPGAWHLDLRAATWLPTVVGGGLMVETPPRLQVGVLLGFMPEPWQDLSASLADVFDDTGAARALFDTVDRTFVVHPTLGLRPSPRDGFLFEVGYQLLRLSGQRSASQVADGLALRVPEAYSAELEQEAILRTDLHQLTARIGWEFLAVGKLIVRLDVGAALTLDARSRVSPVAGAPPAEVRQWLDLGEDELDATLQRYGHTPTVGLTLGYRAR